MDAKRPFRISFVGSGVMAEVMIRGLLSQKVVPPDAICASGPREARALELTSRYGIHGMTQNRVAVEEADIIVLAVKPQSLTKALKSLKGAIRPEQLVMSIIAGARMGRIAADLEHPAIVRCMPNLPCQILRGMTIWTATPDVTAETRGRVKEILSTMGKELYVEDEIDVDRATAVNGTGPAIIAYFVKAMEDGANFIGESRALARQSVLQTIIGTAEMILTSDRHVAELIDGVTSPGGTTSRALHVLHQGRLPAIMTDAINAAFERCVELGDMIDDQASIAKPKGGKG